MGQDLGLAYGTESRSVGLLRVYRSTGTRVSQILVLGHEKGPLME